jgi:Spy/CpxP family protein refolding chaperone
MIKRILIGILMIFMVSLPDFAGGQDIPAGKWWYNQEIVQNLKLTQSEIHQLDQLYVDSHRRLIELKSAVERERFELDTLLGKKTVDDAKVRQQFKRLESARTALADERLRFVIRVREIMGVNRYQQLIQQLKTSNK